MFGTLSTGNGLALITDTQELFGVWTVTVSFWKKNTPVILIYKRKFESNINSGATWHFFNTFPLRGHEKCLDRVSRQQLSALGL